MARGFRSNRSKSTSDILDGAVSDENDAENSSENKHYRTFAFEDVDGEKGPSTPKSQNFVKKLIASLERKNEVCKADDEFVKKYYRRNDYSNLNSDKLYDNRLQDSNTRETNEDYELPRVETNERFLKADNLCVSSKNKANVFANIKLEDQFLMENHGKNSGAKRSISMRRSSNKKGSVIKTNDQHRGKYRDENNANSTCDGFPRSMYNEHKGKKFHNCSSFDPDRTRIELEGRADPFDSYFLRKCKNDQNSNTLERIFENSKEGRDSTFNGRSRKKLGRRRSFIDFFGSMMRWKKSDNDNGPRRFMSCDHLIEETKTFDSRNIMKLPRVSSLKAVVLQDENKYDWIRTDGQKATIHPIYKGKRNEQLSEALTKSKEKYFGLNDSMENLVKPSAIKDIAKRLSQQPDKLQSNVNFYERGRRSVKNGYRQ